MIVVLTFVEFVDRFAAFKVTATQDACLLKLCQHPVYGCQSDIRALQQQHPENIFSRQMALATALKDLQYFQSRNRGLETGAFQFVDVGHWHLSAGIAQEGKRCSTATILRS